MTEPGSIECGEIKKRFIEFLDMGEVILRQILQGSKLFKIGQFMIIMALN